MFIYRTFLLSLLKGEINMAGDQFVAELMNTDYTPSPDDTWEAVDAFKITESEPMQVIFSPSLDEDGTLCLNIQEGGITWTDVSGECGSIIIRKDDLMVAQYKLTTNRSFFHSNFKWEFTDFCMKFGFEE